MRRAIQILGATTLLIGLAAAVLLGVQWLDHGRTTSLPAPTGPFAIGRSTYVWRDALHADSMAPRAATPRELIAWVWYPAAPPRPPLAASDYLPAPWRTALERRTGPVIATLATRDLSRVRARSLPEVELSPGERSYPVVLMRAGLAALSTDYTTLAEDLASHGYVVVGLDAPYRSLITVFPDGRVIARSPQNDADRFSGVRQERLAIKLVRAWSADMGFALDQLERLNASDPSGKWLGRLDMQRVGVLGHSLGGATALQFCHDDHRCKAGVDLDGAPLGDVVRDGVAQPFMFILSDHGGESEAETRGVKAHISSIYDRLPSDRRLDIVIRGANHFGFSDAALWRAPLVTTAMQALGVVKLDGRRQLPVTQHYVDGFFDVYLKGAPASQLKSRPDYPEVAYAR